jgi:uncharacterized membrane protein
MVMLKNKKLILAVFLLFGLGYFSAISNLEVNNFWRGELALIPLQILALIYVSYLRWNRNDTRP